MNLGALSCRSECDQAPGEAPSPGSPTSGYFVAADVDRALAGVGPNGQGLIGSVVLVISVAVPHQGRVAWARLINAL